ncbi:hypothetical protein NLG97_g1581 [Lecanicillium saksenae]|uniref:Uncharacterized protein n=1 Tax=Lecanicillium saksenae TaxID=468837 RepID=A0ACC1R613_9HYPO|nr:hypothetical protein NLG97_g1581 [Lecanicillium saksenae]
MLPNLATWLGVFALLCVQVIAGGVAGGLERVHLWDAYELAWLWKGKKQAYLFPDFKLYKNLGSTPVVPGTDEDGKFTFKEFIENMDNRQPCNVEGPSDSRDAMTVAKELNDAGFNKDITGIRFNRGLESKKKSSGKSYYWVLHEEVASMVKAIGADAAFTAERAKNPELDAKVSGKIARMKDLTKMIESIRTDDFGNWLKDDLIRARDATIDNKVKGRKPIPNPGLGIPESDLKMDEITNEYDGTKYQRVNLEETIKSMKESDPKGKQLRKDLKEFVKNYGDDKFKLSSKDLQFTDASKTHFQTLSLWKAMKIKFHAC